MSRSQVLTGRRRKNSEILYTVGDRIFETLVFVNFSAQDASILKISVPISKRRSWGFQNTLNMWSLNDLGPSYCNLKKIKVSQNNFDWRLLFWNCYNPAQNNPHFASWGCFGILRTSSCWWQWLIFKIDVSWAEKLMKTRVSFLTAPSVVRSS